MSKPEEDVEETCTEILYQVLSKRDHDQGRFVVDILVEKVLSSKI